ncbi:MAG: chorismate mutase [Bacteroidia bacterium]
MNQHPTLKISALRDWLPNAGNPLLISGPCGAETEKQVLETALELKKKTAVSIFRAGIWKPRTRPNSFEGAGSIALQWLKKVKAETGLLTAVEVANAHHVHEALEGGVDVLWIGARTTANPFSVQEIADALKDVDIPVMVKNPVNPDVQLWMGALERINQAGITKLIAIHRGFSAFKKTKYRNDPQWQIPIELKLFFPELPIICDPSHICGKRNLLASVAQKALDMDMAGLMIESHIHPDKALSDAQQQITPDELAALMKGLIVKNPNSHNKEFKNRLEQLRVLMDEIDDELFQSLAKRMEIAEEIGEYKRDNNVTVLQIKRWESILNRQLKMAETLGLSEDFIKEILEAIHKESIQKQIQIVKKNSVKRD